MFTSSKQIARAFQHLDYAPTDPLLTAREAATERRQGISTFWRDVKNGAVPQPYYVGAKSPRWRLSEIRASVEVTKKAPINLQTKASA